jgi:hypothetical protein
MYTMDKIPKIKTVNIGDVFSIMFSGGGAGETLSCQVKDITKDEKDAPVIVFAIMSENAEHQSCFVGGCSIYKSAMGCHKGGLFTVNTKQWASFKWKARVRNHTSEKLHIAYKMAEAGNIIEAALTLDSKEAAVAFLSHYIHE